jgi:hypothetical protein
VSITYEEFLTRLRDSDGLMFRNVRNALVKAADRMRSSAQVNATSFPKVISGELKKSIHGVVLEKPKGKLNLVLRAGGTVAPSRPYEEVADIVYARVQELGGGPFNIREKRYLGRARDKHLPSLEKEMDLAIKLSLLGKKLR